jgi:hypothetical protein
MKCGHCQNQITTNGNTLPTLKVEPVRLQGEREWTHEAAAVICPFCDAILGFERIKVTNG